LRDSATALS